MNMYLLYLNFAFRHQTNPSPKPRACRKASDRHQQDITAVHIIPPSLPSPQSLCSSNDDGDGRGVSFNEHFIHTHDTQMMEGTEGKEGSRDVGLPFISDRATIALERERGIVGIVLMLLSAYSDL